MTGVSFDVPPFGRLNFAEACAALTIRQVTRPYYPKSDLEVSGTRCLFVQEGDTSFFQLAATEVRLTGSRRTARFLYKYRSCDLVMT